MKNNWTVPIAGFLSLLMFAGAALLVAQTPNITPPVPSAEVKLSWDFPPDKTNAVFRVYHSTNLTIPKTNWAVLQTTTNKVAVLRVPVGVNFFAITASNFWGETGFSTVVDTPLVLVSSDLQNISITKQD